MKLLLCNLTIISFMLSMPSIVGAQRAKGSASFDLNQEKNRRLKKSEGKSGKKGSACPSCAEQLPGYSLYGDYYFDEDFDPFSSPSSSLDSDETGPLINYFGFTCLNVGDVGFGQAADFLCAATTFISELIYRTDILRCLLLSLTKTARDVVCFILDVGGYPNMDVVGSNVYVEPLERGRGRQLNEHEQNVRNLILQAGGGGGGSADQTTMELLMLTGNADLHSILLLLDLVDEGKVFLLEMADSMVDSSARKLQTPDFPRDGSDEDFFADINTFFNQFLDDSDLQLAVQGNLFIYKCLFYYGLGLPTCALLFGITKTLDATICHYHEELGCSVTEDCTADVDFKLEYTAQRLAIDIPNIDNPATDPVPFLLADILAPCGSCILEQTGGCAPFCNFVDGFNTCDPIRRLWWAQYSYGPDAAFGDLVQILQGEN